MIAIHARVAVTPSINHIHEPPETRTMPVIHTAATNNNPNIKLVIVDGFIRERKDSDLSGIQERTHEYSNHRDQIMTIIPINNFI